MTRSTRCWRTMRPRGPKRSRCAIAPAGSLGASCRYGSTPSPTLWMTPVFAKATACRCGCPTAPRRSPCCSPVRATGTCATPRSTATTRWRRCWSWWNGSAPRRLFAEEGWGIDGNRQDVFGLASRLDSMRKVFRLPNEREAGNDLPSPEITPRHMAGRDASPDKVFYLAFTSGTTGMPKAVMHSDNTLLANARAMVEDWGHGPETVLLSLSPLSHHIAWVGLAQALAAGGEFAVDDVPPGLSRLDWIVESGATYVMGVPTHAMGHPRRATRPRARPARPREALLHGRCADPADHRRSVSCARRHAAEHLRHDREFLTSLHPADRRCGHHRRHLWACRPRLRDPYLQARQPR